MRLIIMGTGPFAVPSCLRLQEAGYEIAQVIVRPPANAKAPASPVHTWARESGLPVYQPTSINAPESLDRLRALAADLFFVCDYGQILSRDCLAAARLGGVNLHGSLLPRHRGAAPVQWTLLAGDPLAGVSVIHMTPGLDAGPVLSQRAVSVLPDENAAELEQRLAQVGTEATLEAVRLLAAWDRQAPIGTPQDAAQTTKAPRLSKADGRLDCSLPAIMIERRVRGLQPWPGVFGELVYSDTKILTVHLRAARAIASDISDRLLGSAWSTSAAALGESGPQWSPPWDQLLAIQTGEGLLVASAVQPSGKRTMTVAEFLRGHPLTKEARFR